jgi:hypothetical protein
MKKLIDDAEQLIDGSCKKRRPSIKDIDTIAGQIVAVHDIEKAKRQAAIESARNCPELRGACVLNNGAVVGKPFNVDQFKRLKASGDLYYESADDLEEMDEFDKSPGWYVSNNGIRKAIEWHVPVETNEMLQQKKDAEKAEFEARSIANAKRSLLRDVFQWCGEYPDPGKKSLSLDGERFDDPQNPQIIYGGGEWYVLQEKEKMWHVQNNGMDGDDWSRNNIRTGGAGAIGRMLPYNEKIAGMIRDLKK